jgi:hypothetical protein
MAIISRFPIGIWELASISLWEQREAMKRLHAEGHRLVDERLIFETALAQRNLVDSARKTTRKRRNKQRLQHLQRTTIATHAASTI